MKPIGKDSMIPQEERVEELELQIQDSRVRESRCQETSLTNQGYE